MGQEAGGVEVREVGQEAGGGGVRRGGSGSGGQEGGGEEVRGVVTATTLF